VRFTCTKLSVLLTAALLATPLFAASNVRRAPSVTSTRSSAKSKTAAAKTHAKSTKSTKAALTRRARARRPKGQQAIQPERVTQIQQALIREHYFSGDADGNWDDSTIAAMKKYQADQGWQTKLMPDSRAIKKLGLGPDYSGAINAKNSSFAEPPPISSIPNDQATGFTAASGVNQ